MYIPTFTYRKSHSYNKEQPSKDNGCQVHLPSCLLYMYRLKISNICIIFKSFCNTNIETQVL